MTKEQDSGWESDTEWTGIGNNNIEWTGIGDDETAAMSEDDLEAVVPETPSPGGVKPASRVKVKTGPKKPLFIRDLVKAQIRTNSQSNTLGSKKRKLADDGDR